MQSSPHYWPSIKGSLVGWNHFSISQQWSTLFFQDSKYPVVHECQEEGVSSFVRIETGKFITVTWWKGAYMPNIMPQPLSKPQKSFLSFSEEHLSWEHFYHAESALLKFWCINEGFLEWTDYKQWASWFVFCRHVGRVRVTRSSSHL